MNAEKAALEIAAEEALAAYGEDSQEYQAAQAAVAAKDQEIVAEQAKVAEIQAQYTAANAAYEATKVIVDNGPAAWAALDAQLLEYAKDLNETGMMEIKTSEDIDKIKPALEEALKLMDDGIVQMEEAMTMIVNEKVA